LAILLIIITLAGRINLLGSIKQRITSPTGGFAISIRIIQWRHAINMIEDFPILGTGPNTYTHAISRYVTPKDEGFYPHNAYLHMAAETGLLGLGAFLWVLWLFFVGGLKALKNSAQLRNGYKRGIIFLGVMAGVFAILVQSFFDTNLFALRLVTFFWIMLGIGTALMVRLNEKVS